MNKLLVTFATMVAILAVWQLASLKDSKRLFKNGLVNVVSNRPHP